MRNSEREQVEEDYKIVGANYPQELEKIVNEHLKNGYKLAGGIGTGAGGRMFYQAIVKKVKVEIP